MSEIVIENVSKTYHSKYGEVNALKNISLSIESGDIFGIIGMSGAGKSTLVRCMNFLEVPTSGPGADRGKSLADFSGKELRTQRQQIGMIFHAFQSAHAEICSGKCLFPALYTGKEKEGSQRTRR